MTRSPPIYYQPPRSSTLGAITLTTDGGDFLGTSPVVTLLLGVALGAGLAGLIFTWK